MYNDKNFPCRGFSTPRPSFKSMNFPSPRMAMSERKRLSPFHVIHKVPAGDSPYVKAKQVQLIEKDPSKAISLFWAAINSGDRVDSALKDMAIVMKQLDRSDEAIEAIKSFRHLCPLDSQESLDNVLVELYKRSGRIEEEVEMLECKLKHIEEGTAFGGRRTKMARSQGKKVQITVEQERSRILGNLAWAYLQLKNYELAEEYYRKALSMETDKNKQCNLAICLMNMNKLSESRALLQAVRASSRGKQMDESFSKSFERACQMLAEMESESNRKMIAKSRSGESETLSLPRNLDVPFTQPRNSSRGIKRFAERDGNLDRNLTREMEVLSSTYQSGYSSPAPAEKYLQVPFTQPKGSIWSSDNRYERRGTWRNDVNIGEIRSESTKRCLNLEFTENNPRDLGNLIDREKNQKSDAAVSGEFNPQLQSDSLINRSKKSWADMVEEEEEENEEFRDENLNLNLHRSHGPTINQNEDRIQTKLEQLNLKDEGHSFGNLFPSTNSTARRSLRFDEGQQQKKQSNEEIEGTEQETGRKEASIPGGNIKLLKRRHRLQVFEDITVHQETP